MIRLEAPAATLELYDLADGRKCSPCNADPPRPAELGLDVRPNGPGAALTVHLCPQCVAEAFAVHLGRRHVQAGGTVDDLTYPDPPAIPDGAVWDETGR